MTVPPVGEPSARQPPDPPSILSGAFWKTAKDHYSRLKHKNSIFEGSSWKVIVGISFLGVRSNAKKITLGWEHKTVKGGTIGLVIPWENKVNIGAVCNYIIMDKSETTLLNKSEWILGWKLSKVNGKKTKFEGSNRVEASAIERAHKTNELKEHVMAAERIMTSLLDREVKDLEEQHAKVESVIKRYQARHDKIEADLHAWNLKAFDFKADVRICNQECETVLGKYTDFFKSKADAAHQINTSGQMKMSISQTAKFVGQSLIKLGAALTKAG